MSKNSKYIFGGLLFVSAFLQGVALSSNYWSSFEGTSGDKVNIGLGKGCLNSEENCFSINQNNNLDVNPDLQQKIGGIILLIFFSIAALISSFFIYKEKFFCLGAIALSFVCALSALSLYGAYVNPKLPNNAKLGYPFYLMVVSLVFIIASGAFYFYKYDIILAGSGEAKIAAIIASVAPNVSTLAPNVSTLAPNVSTLAPNVSTLAPNVAK
jgi:hypothetical protein